MHDNKPIVWLYGEVKTPPSSQEARIETDVLLRRINLECPAQNQYPVGTHCHELRVRDADKNWRIIYRIDNDAIPDY